MITIKKLLYNIYFREKLSLQGIYRGYLSSQMRHKKSNITVSIYIPNTVISKWKFTDIKSIARLYQRQLLESLSRVLEEKRSMRVIYDRQ